MNASLDRALILINQSRYELAQQELRQLLASQPHSAVAHAWLGQCLVELKQYKEALQEAELAIHLAPDLPFVYYSLSVVLGRQRQLEKAETAIEAAIRLNPENSGYFGVLAAIRYDRGKYADALESADRGLRLDPEEINCLNIRARALLQMNRLPEAQTAIRAALAENPENETTHTIGGWIALHQGDVPKAKIDFREALRLHPQQEWARRGLVEALKARNPIYRFILQYDLWRSRLTVSNRLVLMSVIAFVPPLRVLYLVFILLSSASKPVFALMLRLDPFGRLILSRKEILDSNWTVAILVVTLLSIVGCLITRNPVILSAIAILVLIRFIAEHEFQSGTDVYSNPGIVTLFKSIAKRLQPISTWDRRKTSIFTILLALTALILTVSALLVWSQLKIHIDVNHIFLYAAIAILALFYCFMFFVFVMFLYSIGRRLWNAVKRSQGSHRR